MIAASTCAFVWKTQSSLLWSSQAFPSAPAASALCSRWDFCKHANHNSTESQGMIWIKKDGHNIYTYVGMSNLELAEELLWRRRKEKFNGQYLFIL